MRMFWRRKKDTVEDEGAEGNGVEASEGTLELTHVGPYEIVAPIGTGGMGTVYKAVDRKRDQTVAIKVLDRRYDLDVKKRRRDYLGREILIAASLHHPCIVKMSRNIIEQEDSQQHVRRCLVMEYVDGHNLRKHIVERDLPLNQMIDLSIRICEGLDFLHQNDIVHRDIKPENFLLSRDLSSVKICDFGLSKSTASWRTRWIKEGGGTRRYMSPEQLAKKSLDARSDIFSFGITAYEFLAGKHPCTGSDSKEIMQQLRSRKYKFPAPSTHNKEITPQIDRIVLKALRRNAERRYQSVTQMLLDLTRVAESRI